MKKGLLIVLAIVVVLALVCVSGYNSIVGAETNVETQSANIDTQLQRRADLIPNLVSTVKGYAKHEESVFKSVTDARSALMGATTMEEKAAANDQLTGALGKLIAVAEAYPDLKANTVYLDLMDNLSGTENRISVARKDYNEAAQTYNKKIKTFPGNLFAGVFGFEQVKYFEAAEGSEKAPQVSFD